MKRKCQRSWDGILIPEGQTTPRQFGCSRLARVARVTPAGKIVALCIKCDEATGDNIGQQLIPMCWKCANVRMSKVGDFALRIDGCRETICTVTGIESKYHTNNRDDKELF